MLLLIHKKSPELSDLCKRMTSTKTKNVNKLRDKIIVCKSQHKVSETDKFVGSVKLKNKLSFVVDSETRPDYWSVDTYLILNWHYLLVGT